MIFTIDSDATEENQAEVESTMRMKNLHEQVKRSIEEHEEDVSVMADEEPSIESEC